MEDVDHQQLKQLIIDYYWQRQSLFVVGPPAIGKSDMFREAGREIADTWRVDDKPHPLRYSEKPKDMNRDDVFYFDDIRLLQMDPSDVRGIPFVFIKFVDVDNDKIIEVPISQMNSGEYNGGRYDFVGYITKWCTPSMFPTRGQGIILFDELPNAVGVLQASVYQAFLRHRIGDYIIPDGFGVFAAGNREKDSAGVKTILTPLWSRFGWCELIPPTIEKWREWAMRETVQIDSRILTFLHYRSNYLFKFDPRAHDEKAQPLPRNWERASKLIVNISSEDRDRLRRVLATNVGGGVAVEFIRYLELKDNLPPLEEYFDNPTTVLIPDDTDTLWSLIGALVDFYRRDKQGKTGKKNLKALLELTARIGEAKHSDFSILLMRMSAAVDKEFRSKLLDMRKELQKLKKFKKYLF